MNQNTSPLNPDLQNRLGGLVFFLGGLFLGYFTVIYPLREALQQQPYVSSYPLGAFLTPPAIILGLYLLIAGGRADEHFSKNPVPKGIWFLIVLCFLLGLLFSIGSELFLSWLGYGRLF